MAAQETGTAAIGSSLAANIYGLQIVASNIEDLTGNKTRFFVVSTPDKAPQASGHDKTSLTFLTPHKPGALVDVLGVFGRHGVNISMIQSRPSRQQAWEYRFFADVAGHRDDEKMQAALEELQGHTVSYKVIGSYPEA
jgi:chorismate mutase/prephenate dehydratase